MSPDRVVRTTLVIDEHGSVRVLKGVGDEAGKTEGKLSHLDHSVKEVGKKFGGLKSMLAGGLGLVGAGGLIFGLKDVIEKTKEVASETEKFHSITGIGAQQSMQYTQALKARGISGEAAASAFGFLSKNLRTAELQEDKFGKAQTKTGTATTKATVAHEKSTIAVEKARLALSKAEAGGKAYAIMQAQLGLKSAEASTKLGAATGGTTAEVGRQAKALKELTGMSAAQFKALGSEEEKLKTVTKAFEHLAAGEKKTRLEKELMGKGALALAPVLENNNLNIDRQAEKVRKYFGVIQGGAKGQQELLEKQSEAKMAWEGLEFQLGSKLTPVIIKVFEVFAKIIPEIEKGTGAWGDLEHTFEGIYKFGKGVADTIKEIAKALGVKLPEGTLGAVLAAAGLHSAKHPVKASKTTAHVVKDVGKYALEHPYLAPAILAAGGVAAYGAETYKERHHLAAHAEGALAMLGGGPSSLGQIERSFLGGAPMGTGGGRRLGGRPAAGETPGEAALVAKAIEGLRGTHDTATIHLHLDAVKVAEAQIHNPRARRLLAEAATIYAHGMAARGHG